MSTATPKPIMQSTPARPEPGTGMARASLLQKLGGYVHTQLTYLLAKSGVADLLMDGPQTSAALAAALKVAQDPLHRLLRGCVTSGLLVEVEPGLFAATPLTQLLESACPDSLRNYAILTGELWYPAWSNLLTALQTESPAFETFFGVDYYDYLAQRPELALYFQQFMQARTLQSAQALIDVYDFSSVTSVVDVGGGNGTLLQQVLMAHPHLQGALYDLPTTIAEAQQRPTLQALGNRCQLIGGSFLEGVPAGYDAYVVSQVLHNWADEQCLQLLRNCRAAIQPQGSLLVLEQVIQPRSRENIPAIEMDLMMMTLTKGRERTLEEHQALLAAAGFTLVRTEQIKKIGLTLLEAKITDG